MVEGPRIGRDPGDVRTVDLEVNGTDAIRCDTPATRTSTSAKGGSR